MVKKIKIHYQLIYLVITTSKVITRFNKEKCTEFSSHKFLCADDIIYVVSDDVKFRFQFAVQNMLDVIL